MENEGGQRRGGVARVMFKKDACYANSWWICYGCAMRPWLTDGSVEVTSGGCWSGTPLSCNVCSPELLKGI